jgi:hypothetical protein
MTATRRNISLKAFSLKYLKEGPSKSVLLFFSPPIIVFEGINP